MNPHLVFSYEQIMRRNGCKSVNFCHQIITRQLSSIPASVIKEQRAKITDRACFVIFWGAQNIAGERSLKIPYSTIDVKSSCSCSVIATYQKIEQESIVFYLPTRTDSATLDLIQGWGSRKVVNKLVKPFIRVLIINFDQGKGISKRNNTNIGQYYIDNASKCRQQAREFQGMEQLVVYINQSIQYPNNTAVLGCISRDRLRVQTRINLAFGSELLVDSKL